MTGAELRQKIAEAEGDPKELEELIWIVHQRTGSAIDQQAAKAEESEQAAMTFMADFAHTACARWATRRIVSLSANMAGELANNIPDATGPKIRAILKRSLREVFGPVIATRVVEYLDAGVTTVEDDVLNGAMPAPDRFGLVEEAVAEDVRNSAA